jgi:hypothetical protein
MNQAMEIQEPIQKTRSLRVGAGLRPVLLDEADALGFQLYPEQPRHCEQSEAIQTKAAARNN